MNFDKHGQLHAGTVGLFDCPYEHDETQNRLRERQERREKSELKHDRKRGRRQVTGSRFPAPLRWLTKYFGWGKVGPKTKARPEFEEKTHDDTVRENSHRRLDASAKHEAPSSESNLVVLEEDEVEEDETYPASALHPEPSILLEECGMVRVRSNNPRDFGWKIVPKSCIRQER
ncbi:hypothetical protein K491DRAFT_723595 [Lophiostoma macrostomum CBS 122681]|uniref:Uncharacterized protein n=1 Tax=Lophiostoma macrostomum CBS 122681 TaxID=1314788 RepID=A0A6A6SLL3_9PLEO|nr:hypothetical protein K491DRAFT_723595 [Lophiostoma macrostomum CBS 122681]